MKKGLAILASGSGSNAQALMEYFAKSEIAEVRLLVSNKSEAYALERAKAFGVPTLIIDKEGFYENYASLKEQLAANAIDTIVLAGFLWLVPNWLLKTYADKVINIHPSLLPKFGGKGMHGIKVHQAVKEAKETKTGITIHLCNQQYDKGAVLFQAECAVHPFDEPADIAGRVLELEHKYFAPTIEAYISGKIITWEIPQ